MDRYTLPNGIVINSDSLIYSVLREEDFPEVYLDTVTGAMIEIPSKESLVQWVKEIGKSERYITMDPFTREERTEIAKEFVETMLIDELEEKKLEKVRAIAATGEWRDIAYYLIEETDGWIHAWDQFINDEAYQRVHEWLVNNPKIKITASFDGCGDCAICRAMASGDKPGFEELLKLFETENIMKHIKKQMTALKQPEQIHSNTAVVEKEGKAEKGRGKQAAKATDKKTVQSNEVLEFKVSLMDTAPSVWRRIVVPADYTFYDLHRAIQNAFGWEDAHLHAFNIDVSDKKSGNRKGRSKEVITLSLPNPGGDMFGDVFDSDDQDEREEVLSAWFPEKNKRCHYEYDFGDGWEHEVVLEKVMPREKGAKYPQCTAGQNACPPEDCGGVYGYENLKEVLADPKHEEHEDFLDWLGLEKGSDFDPTKFDPKKVKFR